MQFGVDHPLLDKSAESSYYSWVDQHNTFGLGNDVPMSTGNLNDGIIVAFANGRMGCPGPAKAGHYDCCT